jgi:phage gp36-like protein
MANPYCTFAQLAQIYDPRLINELTDDSGLATITPVQTTAQLWLDIAASELESLLAARWALPLLGPIPLILTKLVAIMAVKSAFAHRTEIPDGVARDIEWCDKFLEDLRLGTRSIPGIDRNNSPSLLATPSTSGKSRFDNMPLQDQSGNTRTSLQGGCSRDLPGVW